MRKFIESSLLTDLQVETDKGWVDIFAIHKTVEYEIFQLITTNCILCCADDHIVFKDNFEEVFVKSLKIGDIILTKFGSEEIIDVSSVGWYDNMYDLELDVDSDKRYYTNGILSHNTSFIRHLACQVKKEVLFLPPSLAHQISDPAFITFLMNHSNSIVVIEDAEKVILDRETGSGNDQGVSNILNLTDGILSDCLSIQIIATFNTTRDKIDSALLRKGRLLAEHKFDNLNVEESNTLLKHLGKDFITNIPMTLTDIYNIEEDDMRVQEERRVIGFANR